jgi:hypothetical protein
MVWWVCGLRLNLRPASVMVLVFLVSSVECLQIALINLLSVAKMYNLFLYSHKNNALSGTHSHISITKILQKTPICNKRIFIRKLRATSFQDISQNIIIHKCLNIGKQFLKFWFYLYGWISSSHFSLRAFAITSSQHSAKKMHNIIPKKEPPHRFLLLHILLPSL